MATPVTEIHSFVSRFDRYQRAHRRVGVLYAIFKKYSEDEAGHKAALLTYYGFLAVFPLLLVLTSIVNLLLRNNSELSGQIIHAAVSYFPIIGRELQQNIHGLKETGIALVVGIALTLFGARGVADCLRSGLDHIWQIPYAKRSRFPGSLVRSMGIVIVGGIGLVLAPLLSAYTLAFNHGEFFNLVSVALTLAILFGVMVFIIKVGVSVRRPFKDIWIGAAIAAASLYILQAVGGYILARELSSFNSLYGTFALVLGLIFWIYLQAQVLFYVFELDSVRIMKLWPRSVRTPLTEADHRAYDRCTVRSGGR